MQPQSENMRCILIGRDAAKMIIAAVLYVLIKYASTYVGILYYIIMYTI